MSLRPLLFANKSYSSQYILMLFVLFIHNFWKIHHRHSSCLPGDFLEEKYMSYSDHDITKYHVFLRLLFHHIVLHYYIFLYLFLAYIMVDTNIELLSIIKRYCKVHNKAAEAARKFEKLKGIKRPVIIEPKTS